MAFGTLGTPDVTVQDFRTIASTGTPTYTQDGLGGFAVVSDGAGGGASLPAWITVGDRFFTYALVFNCPAVSSNSLITNADNLSTARNFQMKLRSSDRELQTNTFGGSGSVGSEAQNSFNGPYDDSNTYLAIHSVDYGTPGDTGDHIRKLYVGPLDGSLEDLTEANSAQLTYLTGVAIVFFCRGQTGQQPLPNGGWVGQYRAWANKFCDSTDALAIQAEYLALTRSDLAKRLCVTDLATAY